jgi:hypothetical protein
MTSTSKAAAKPKPKAKPKRRFDKGALFRLSRMLHAYLSAFAFLALIFFAATGLLLNHPDWIDLTKMRETTSTVTLSKADLDAAAKASDPNAALGKVLSQRTKLLGGYKSGETLDGEASLRFEGVRGYSDAYVQLDTGAAEITVKHANPVTTINELHRGKNSGKAWAWVIDLSAVIVLALSLIGYILFFSLRFRLMPSLILTGVSLAVLLAVFVLFVP